MLLHVTAAAPEYIVVQMALRAPRVAIVVDGGARWTGWFCAALAAATRCWGGAGLILVRHRAGVVDAPALAMVVRAVRVNVDLPSVIGRPQDCCGSSAGETKQRPAGTANAS